MPEEMAQRIKKLRQDKGLTLEQVAEVVGVGKSTVRKWETGMIANMRRDKIADLAKALGTTPAYLMGWKEDEDKKDSLDETKLTGGQSDRNVIKIAGRDGSFRELRLTDDQMKALNAFIDLLPEVPDDL